MTTTSIKKCYFDALFFASATENEKEKYFLRGAEFRVILKLIHYDTIQNNITWSSEVMSKHLTTSVGSIDKTIMRLKQKGYINISNTQIDKVHKSRTIWINWDFILKIDELYKKHNEAITPQTEMVKLDSQHPEAVQFFDEIVETEIKESGKYQVVFTKAIKEDTNDDSPIDIITKKEEELYGNMLEFFIEEEFEKRNINDKIKFEIIFKQAMEIDKPTPSNILTLIDKHFILSPSL